jgi:hypothetical protein
MLSKDSLKGPVNTEQSGTITQQVLPEIGWGESSGNNHFGSRWSIY